MGRPRNKKDRFITTTEFLFLSLILNMNSNYSLIVSQLWFKNDIYYPNDGIVYPGKDSWWETKIEWEKYWMDEEYYYPSCEFTLEGIE